jgi:hypothetical protein
MWQLTLPLHLDGSGRSSNNDDDGQVAIETVLIVQLEIRFRCGVEDTLLFGSCFCAQQQQQQSQAVRLMRRYKMLKCEEQVNNTSCFTPVVILSLSTDSVQNKKRKSAQVKQENATVKTTASNNFLIMTTNCKNE